MPKKLKKPKRTSMFGSVSLKSKKMLLFAAVFGAIGLYMIVFSSAATPGSSSSCKYEDRSCMYNSHQGHIMRLYKGTFNNYGDKGGVDYWTGVYKNAGYDLSEAGQHIVYSNSKIANMGKADFVKAMYSNYLGRTPSQSDIAYWSGVMPNNTAKQKVTVMYNISQGTEATNRIQKPLSDKIISFYNITPTPKPAPAPTPPPSGGSSGTVTTSEVKTNSRLSSCGTDTACIYGTREGHISRIYWAMSKTAGDKNGLGYWMSKYNSSSNQVGAWMLETDGGRALRNMSSDDFVKRLYLNFTGRNADSSGLAYWKARIGSGSTNDRAKLILHFSETTESKNYAQVTIANSLRGHYGTSSSTPPEVQVGYESAPADVINNPAPAAVAATPPPSKPALTAGCPSDINSRPTLRSGSNHACVSYLQRMLNYRNNAGLPGTVVFGPSTASAVKAYQQRFGLSADSIVGKQTWTHLETNQVVSVGTTGSSSGSSSAASSRTARTAAVSSQPSASTSNSSLGGTINNTFDNLTNYTINQYKLSQLSSALSRSSRTAKLLLSVSNGCSPVTGMRTIYVQGVMTLEIC